jgi:hypothetical protein
MLLLLLLATALLVVAGIQLRAAARALADQRPGQRPADTPGTLPAEPPPLAVLTAPTWAVNGTWRGPDDEG